MAARKAQRRHAVLRAATALALLAGTLVTFAVAAAPASAATPYTFTSQQFDGLAFPPADWTVHVPTPPAPPQGTWSQSCAATPTVTVAGTGCSALATITGADLTEAELRFDPAALVPSSLQNPRLRFTSTFTRTPTGLTDSVAVLQAMVEGSTGDMNTLAFPAVPNGPTDPEGVPTAYDVPLNGTALPLVFRWTSYGNTDADASKTWRISDVSITGTVPTTAYTLTADPIPNTTYLHVKGGTTRTLTLSGSSNPTGDSLSFAVVQQPQYGTLGAITPVDATHATVPYTAAPCPNPTGVSGFLCVDTFTYKAFDLAGNESSAAQAVLDVHPEGAGSVTVTVAAPTAADYATLWNGTAFVTASDLGQEIRLGPTTFPDRVRLRLQVLQPTGETPAPLGALRMPALATSGTALEDGTASGDSTIVLSGSVPQLNTALNQLLYEPPAGTTPTRELHVSTVDLGPEGIGPFATGASAMVLISPTPVLTKPSLAMPTGPLATVAGGPPLTFLPGATTGFAVTDAEATSTTLDTVLLGVTGGSLSLPAADTAGAAQIVTATSSIGSLTLTGTVANLNTALGHLTYDATGLGTSTVTLTASVMNPDSGLASTQQSVTIDVKAPPSPFGTSAFTTRADVPATVFLCAGGTSTGALSYAITSAPAHGTFVPNAGATGSGCSQNASNLVSGYTYTPTAGYAGSDSVSYRVDDATTGLSSAITTIAITVLPHTTPTAAPATASTRQDQAVDVVVCGTNPDPEPALAFVLATSPAHGQVTSQGTPTVNSCSSPAQTPHTFRYTPSAGSFTSSGTDSFTYMATNGAYSAPATVSITVATRTPAVFAQSLSVNENGSIGFLLCATTPNAPVTYTVSAPLHGTLDTQAASSGGPACPVGSFGTYRRYVPSYLYRGPDSITYSVTDGAYTSATAIVQFTVLPIDIPPTADDQRLTAIVGKPLSITLTGGSLHALPLTYRVVTQPQRGTLTGTAPNLVYTASSAGADAFTFVATDGVSTSPPATVTLAVTAPALSSSVCLPGVVAIGPSQFTCAGSLQAVADGAGGLVSLAHTSGERVTQLRVQVTVTNGSAVADDVTLRAPAGVDPWHLRYAVDGADVTAQMTGAGLTVTVPALGRAYVQVIAFPPLDFPSPPTARLTVTATSGNDPRVATSMPLLIANGSSKPALTVAQADGSGAVSFPTMLFVSPPLYAGGPAGTVQIVPDLDGTGTSTYRLQVSPDAGAARDVQATYYLARTDVTAALLAGTLEIQCYADIGCPPMRVVLAPGTTTGTYGATVRQTSTIDGQVATAWFQVQVTGAIGPDLSTNLPNVGLGVLEAVPATQQVEVPLQSGSTVTKRLFLQNLASIPDTFRLSLARAAGGDPAVSVALSDLPAGSTVANGVYSIPMPAAVYRVLTVTATAATSDPALPAAAFTYTAASALAPDRADAFTLSFPTYAYQPDITTPQTDLSVDIAPRTTDIALSEKNTGRAPTGDVVVVKATGSDAAFTLSYALRDARGVVTDVTTAVTGVGLPITLAPNGSPGQTLRMTSQATPIARIGAVKWLALSVTSISSSTGARDTLTMSLWNSGTSRLGFVGLPQQEPDDIARDALASRVPPISAGTYTPGKVYGEYNDTTGNKFVYASAHDRFALRLTAGKAAATAYRFRVTSPGTSLGIPTWMRYSFGTPVTVDGVRQVPSDPLAAGGARPSFTVAGQDVTSALLAGTYVTDPLRSGTTLDLRMSFAPGSPLRHTPLRFELVNNATGVVEDVFMLGLSSILSCSDDSVGQLLATAKDASGRTSRLAFHAYDRRSTAATCMQHLTTAWVTRQPVVFSSYQPETELVPAGGYEPSGLWLVPQLGATIRIDAETLAVTSTYAKAYVDTPLLGVDGRPDPATAGILTYSYVGDYPNLTWSTADAKNGLRIPDASLRTSPFPLVKPSTTSWPGNTMEAARYVQVQSTTGTPVVVGEMAVNTPWYKANIPIIIPIDNRAGLSLAYEAPPQAEGRLPGDDSVKTTGMFWVVKKDGVVTQGGCAGLPPTFFAMLDINVSASSTCVVYVVTTYEPIPRDPNVQAQIANVTFGAKVVGTRIGTPEFNLKALSGHVTFVTGTSTVQEVVIEADFGVGPATPCQLEKDARAAAKVTSTLTQDFQGLLCPSNYFFFKAKVTFKQGGFTSAHSTTGVGVRFDGTLSLMGYVNLTHVQADVSTDPFNFHFANSPIALSINVGIPMSATITLAGNVGATGFDISLSGEISIYGETIASASGIISSKGMGLCGGLGGVSMGVGSMWGDPPSFYASGCTTTQYRVA